jgi:hypothetical protein
MRLIIIIITITVMIIIITTKITRALIEEN